MSIPFNEKYHAEYKLKSGMVMVAYKSSSGKITVIMWEDDSDNANAHWSLDFDSEEAATKEWERWLGS